MKGLHGIIFSYEKENGLRELIENRVHGSVPFGGDYRIIDFILSSMVNAGITDVGVIMHGKCQSLLDHLGSGKSWDLSRNFGGLTLLPAFAYNERSHGDGQFRGRVEALYSVMNYLKSIRQDYVVLSDSDTIINIPLEDVLARFTGEIDQVPPMYSAIKINGQKLYQLARKGQEIERPPRRVTIHELALLEPENGDWRLRIRCSKGTYVRALCHDIGQALGCGGCMSALRRTMAAGFTLAESRSIEDVQTQGEALLSPTDSLFRQYPAYHIAGERDHRRCLCGNPLAAEGLQPGLYRVYGTDGTFLCLSRWENGVLTSEKNFFGA